MQISTHGPIFGCVVFSLMLSASACELRTERALASRGVAATQRMRSPRLSVPPTLIEPDEAILPEEDLARGTFHLSWPIQLPEERGRILVDPFPVYQPSREFSEWGAGWFTKLSISRYRETGWITYCPLSQQPMPFWCDQLVGPWGTMSRGTDGFWYPDDFRALVRVAASEDQKTLTAFLSDGSVWLFGEDSRDVGLDPSRDTFRWYLKSVASLMGEVTSLAWNRSPYSPQASSQLYLSRVEYGLRLRPQYRLDFEYEQNPPAWRKISWSSAVERSLDQHVKAVVLSRANGTAWTSDLRWNVDYELDPSSRLNVRSITETAGGVVRRTFGFSYFAPILRPTNNEALHAVFNELAAGRQGVEPEIAKQVLYYDVNSDGLDDVIAPHSLSAPGTRTEFLGAPGGFVRRDVPRPDKLQVFEVFRPRPGPDENASLYGFANLDTHSYTLRPGDGSVVLGYVDGKELPIDLDQDMKPDLVRPYADGFLIRRNVSIPMPMENVWEGIEFAPPLTVQLDSIAGRDRDPRYVDVNGDGLPDLVRETDDAFLAWLNMGCLRFRKQPVKFPKVAVDAPDGKPYDKCSYELADVVGSGNADLFVACQVDSADFEGPRRYYIFQGEDFPSDSQPGSFASRASYVRVGPRVRFAGPRFLAASAFQITFVQAGGVETLLLRHSEAGLLRSYHYPGGWISFTYGRSDDRLSPRLPAVVERIRWFRSGLPELMTKYRFKAPLLHPGRVPLYPPPSERLLGYREVQRTTSGSVGWSIDKPRRYVTNASFGEILTEDFRFSVTPRGSRIVSHHSRAAVPDGEEDGSAVRYHYENDTWQGLPWPRLAEIRKYRWDGDVEYPQSTVQYIRHPSGVPQCNVGEVRQDSDGNSVTVTHSQPRQPTSFPADSQGLACLFEDTVISQDTANGAVRLQHLQRSYDAAGRLAATRVVAGSESVVLESVEWDGPRVVSREWAGQGRDRYEYDPQTGLLVKYVAADGTYVRVKVRDHEDRVTHYAFVRGMQNSYSVHDVFDSQGRILETSSSVWQVTQDAANERHSYESGAFGGNQYGGLDVHYTATRFDQSRSYVDVTLRDSRNSVVAAGVLANGNITFPLTSIRDDYSGVTFSTPDAIPESVILDPISQYRPRRMLASYVEGVGSGSLSEVIDENSTRITRTEGDFSKAYPWHSVQRESVGGDPASLVVSEFDTQDRLIATTYSDIARIDVTYDGLDRIVALRLPDDTYIDVVYDLIGRRERVMWRRAGPHPQAIAEIAYRYYPGTLLVAQIEYFDIRHTLLRRLSVTRDRIGRPATEAWALADGTTQQFMYYYDGATARDPDNRSALGLLTGTSGAGFAKEFRYLPDGTLAYFALLMKDSYVTETYTHYNDGMLKGVVRFGVLSTSAGMKTVRHGSSFDRDDRGRPIARRDNGVVSITYDWDDASLLLRGVGLGSGEGLAFGRDPITGVTSRLSYAPQLRSFERLLTSTGRVGNESGDAMGGRRTFEYDGLGRLNRTESGAESESYAYAFGTGLLAGVLDERSGESFLIPPPYEESFVVEGKRYVINRMGELIQAGPRRFARSPRGDLVRVNTAAEDVGFCYDETGVLIGVLAADGRVTEMHWGNNVFDAAGVRESVPVEGVPVATISVDGHGSSVRSLLGDFRGSSWEDPAAAPLPYGARRSAPADGVFFSGMRYSSATGLYRAGMRNYVAELGRFAELDSLYLHHPELCVSAAANCDLYSFAAGDPVNFVDPSGEQATQSSAGSSYFDDEVCARGYACAEPIVVSQRPFFDPARVDLRDSVQAPWSGMGPGYLPGTLPGDKNPFNRAATWRMMNSGANALALAAVSSTLAGGPAAVLMRIGTATWLPYRVQAMTWSVRLSRFFLNAARYAPVRAPLSLGAAVLRLFPSLALQQHHILIQQAWFRFGIRGARFLPNAAAMQLGLRRLGNAGWNLMPLPARWNYDYLGQSPWLTAGFAVAAYGSVPLVGYGSYLLTSWLIGQ